MDDNKYDSDKGGWMQTFGGRQFFPLAPRPEDVHIEDIAHSLAYQCRYGGHTRFFYSVAEHSALMSDWVALTSTPFNALVALMHDTAEAYIGDVIRAIKHRMPQFLEIERAVEEVVFGVFKLPAKLPPFIKELDNRIICDERRVLMERTRPWVHDELEPLGITIRCWPPAVAEQEFLRRYYALAGAPR